MKTKPNEPCPCNSGLKYKRCCMNKERAAKASSNAAGGPRRRPTAAAAGNSARSNTRAGSTPQHTNTSGVPTQQEIDEYMRLIGDLRKQNNTSSTHSSESLGSLQKLMKTDLFQKFLTERGDHLFEDDLGAFQVEERRYYPKRDTEIGPGVVAFVHSLESSRGKALNNKRCVVLDYLKQEGEGRWLVQVQEEGVTTALKEENLKLPELPAPGTVMHPSYAEMSQWQMQLFGKSFDTIPRKYETARGVTFQEDEPFYRARKLVELLDRSVDSYEPNRTILYGVAVLYYGSVNEASMSSDFSQIALEHVAGLLALCAMCQGELSKAQGCGDGRPDVVVFALLEAAPVSLDVWMGFLAITPYIGPSEGYERVRKKFQSCRQSSDFYDWKLTPDQSNDDYCHIMKGPVYILYFVITKLKEKSGRLDIALLRRLEKHALFSKVIHRLCRLVAREIQGTNDGKCLGHTARIMLAGMADIEGGVDADLYQSIVDGDSPGLKPGSAEKLLRRNDIQSYSDLHSFLREICVY